MYVYILRTYGWLQQRWPEGHEQPALTTLARATKANIAEMAERNFMLREVGVLERRRRRRSCGYGV